MTAQPDAFVSLADVERSPDTSSGIELLNYDQMVNLPEPEWLVDGLIQKRTAALIFGKSNAFKSFCTIDIGLCIATGRQWHGNQVCSGNVLFVATEGANGVGRLRIPAWFNHYVVPLRQRKRVFLYPKEISIDVVEQVSLLIDAMYAAGPFTLLVLDIFGGCMSGSEIEDKTARAWVRGVQKIIRETGASVLTVAHTGWQDDTRARMHTHFWGSFDTRLRVEGDRDALTCSLTTERHKDADSTGSWGFKMTPAGQSLVPVLDETVKPSKTRNLSSKQHIALQALDDAIASHGIAKQGSDWPTCKVVLLDQWRAFCDRHSLSSSDEQEAKKKAFQRARDGLHKKNIIRIFDGHVWRCFDD